LQAVDLYQWTGHVTSLKVAAAVYAALHIPISGDSETGNPDQVWTPTLRYYTTYGEKDVVSSFSVLITFILFFPRAI
jgi:hypothetical protein